MRVMLLTKTGNEWRGQDMTLDRAAVRLAVNGAFDEGCPTSEAIAEIQYEIEENRYYRFVNDGFEAVVYYFPEI